MSERSTVDESTVADPKDSPNSSERSGPSGMWLFVGVALVVGGLLGWIIGRQAGIEADEREPAATVTVLTESEAGGMDVDPAALLSVATPTAAASDVGSVVAGPTPASIRPQAKRTLGDPEAPVTIVEFSDYQCPFCRRHALETMPDLLETFVDSGRVFYVFKDFPIASLHPLAYRLHEAAYCLTEYDDPALYWQAHDLFFERAETFDVETLEAMDEAILTGFQELNLPDISRCLSSGTFAEAVQLDLEEGLSLGVNGTPAFFINGFPISGAQPYELFEYAIELAESGDLQEAYRQSAQESAQAAADATAEAARPREVPLDDDPAKGDPDAPVLIVEYSDYQCPFCRRHFLETMPQLQAYVDAGQVRYVFKDFPITNIHPQAPKAHEAARCAREIGGDEMYWTMHDLLFQNQDAWGQAAPPTHIDVLKGLAAQAQLPQEMFDSCLDSGRYEDAVMAQVDEGRRLGVNGTPAFFINGRPLVGAQPFSVFEQMIQALLPAE